MPVRCMHVSSPALGSYAGNPCRRRHDSNTARRLVLRGRTLMSAMPSSTTPDLTFSLQTNKAACFLLQGRILMTHPTKAIIGTLLKDFVKISSGRAQQGGQQVST